jgi:hypothetical protein
VLDERQHVESRIEEIAHQRIAAYRQGYIEACDSALGERPRLHDVDAEEPRASTGHAA